MASNFRKSGDNTEKKWKTLGVSIERDKYDNIVERLSNISASSVDKDGKMGVRIADVIEQFLDNHLSNSELKNFIYRDFIEQSSTQNRRIDDLTNAVNTLTSTVENLRNLLVLTLSNGDINAALSAINMVNSPAVVREKSGNNDFEFTLISGVNSEHNDIEDTSDLIAAFQQIKVSEYGDNTDDIDGINSSFVTNSRSLKQTNNIHKRRKG